MTTRVDFYQLSRDPVDVTIIRLASRAMQAGERLLIVAQPAPLREHLSDMLWSKAGNVFLANGPADEAHAARQPILLSEKCDAPNEAGIIILADGTWREEAVGFRRVMLLFDEAATGAARDVWRMLATRDDIDNRIHKQTPEGGWREGR